LILAPAEAFAGAAERHHVEQAQATSHHWHCGSGRGGRLVARDGGRRSRALHASPCRRHQRGVASLGALGPRDTLTSPEARPQRWPRPHPCSPLIAPSRPSTPWSRAAGLTC